MFKSLLHQIVAIPAIYNLSQHVAGTTSGHRRIQKLLSSIPLEDRVIVDIGGGTALMRGLFPARCRYLCLDNDPQKLEGIRSKPDAAIESLLGDATAIPLDSKSVDFAILSCVSHHLTNQQLEATLAEINRILKPGGHFLFYDALKNPQSKRASFLWSVDRGSMPRFAEDLHAMIQEKFVTEIEERWRIHHFYILQLNRPKTAAA